MRLDLALARFELIETSRPSVDYCRANGIDFAATVPACGGVFLAEIKTGARATSSSADAWFDPAPGGTLAAWCDVIGDDAETVVDAGAWPVGRPDQVLTLGGTAPALGVACAANPATYALGFPLKIHRTPLAWLQAGCDGAVILDQAAGGRWLRDLEPPQLAAEGAAHAAEIDRMLKAASPMPRILVPSARAA